jgi:nickel/cobalt transporter (NicO) family protein
MIRRYLILLPLLMFAVGMALATPSSSNAHPLGELTINHFSEVRFERDHVTVRYVLDFAELSALEQIIEMDGADQSSVENADLEGYLDRKVPDWLTGLDLTIDDEQITLREIERDAWFHEGNWGFDLLRVEIVARGDIPESIAGEANGRYVVRNFPGRLGWHEVVMPPGEDWAVVETNALRETVTDELSDYPDVTEQEPLQIYDVTFVISETADEQPSGSTDTFSYLSESDPGILQSLMGASERLVDLESRSRIALFLTMAGAFLWGAVHALSPGHGKAVVGAYLIGSRGTPKHAMFLGLTVTATHTAGIFALGFIALGLSHVLLPETVFPYLSLVSGVLVILIGLSIGFRRYRMYRQTGVADDHGHHHHDHHHEHDHSHGHHDHVHDGDHHHHHEHSHLPPGADGTEVTWRSLLALGVSGGMVPCPSALVLLLGAIALGRLELGIVLVLLFSLGLAAVLTGIGLMMVYLRSVFERFSFETRAPGVLPVVSSLAIAFAGVVIVIGSIGQTGILS